MQNNLIKRVLALETTSQPTGALPNIVDDAISDEALARLRMKQPNTYRFRDAVHLFV